jgi:hypothetical protein
MASTQSFWYSVSSENIKDGRHVGLDFYDLLIEALIDPIEGVLSAKACLQQLRETLPVAAVTSPL